MKRELLAVAKMANVNIQEAAGIVRRNPLLGEEIHIDEELINLEEAVAATRASEDLHEYPVVRQHLIRDQRQMLKHCIGQIARMIHGRRLPRQYSQQDTIQALTRLIRLLVDEKLQRGKQIERSTLQIVEPFLSLSQRRNLGEWKSFSPRLQAQVIKRHLSSIW